MPFDLAMYKIGLIENGAGHLACPECHSSRLRLVMVTYTSDHATTVTTTDLVKVTWRGPDERGQQYLAVVFQCDQRHEFGVEMTYQTEDEDVTMGTAAFGTRWQRVDE